MSRKRATYPGREELATSDTKKAPRLELYPSCAFPAISLERDLAAACTDPADFVRLQQEPCEGSSDTVLATDPVTGEQLTSETKDRLVRVRVGKTLRCYDSRTLKRLFSAPRPAPNAHGTAIAQAAQQVVLEPTSRVPLPLEMKRQILRWAGELPAEVANEEAKGSAQRAQWLQEELRQPQVLVPSAQGEDLRRDLTAVLLSVRDTAPSRAAQVLSAMESAHSQAPAGQALGYDDIVLQLNDALEAAVQRALAGAITGKALVSLVTTALALDQEVQRRRDSDLLQAWRAWSQVDELLLEPLAIWWANEQLDRSELDRLLTGDQMEQVMGHLFAYLRREHRLVAVLARMLEDQQLEVDDVVHAEELTRDQVQAILERALEGVRTAPYIDEDLAEEMQDWLARNVSPQRHVSQYASELPLAERVSEETPLSGMWGTLEPLPEEHEDKVAQAVTFYGAQMPPFAAERLEAHLAQELSASPPSSPEIRRQQRRAEQRHR